MVCVGQYTWPSETSRCLDLVLTKGWLQAFQYLALNALSRLLDIQASQPSILFYVRCFSGDICLRSFHSSLDLCLFLQSKFRDLSDSAPTYLQMISLDLQPLYSLKSKLHRFEQSRSDPLFASAWPGSCRRSKHPRMYPQRR